MRHVERTTGCAAAIAGLHYQDSVRSAGSTAREPVEVQLGAAAGVTAVDDHTVRQAVVATGDQIEVHGTAGMADVVTAE